MMSTPPATKSFVSDDDEIGRSINIFPNKSYVMVSYSWANKEDVNVLINRLSPFLKIWRDINSLPGSSDLWNTIALAVQEAEFFIPVISAEYEKSDSCTNELNFALNNKQIVVPIFLDPSFRPTGNVGLRISKLYYMAFEHVVENPLILIKHLNTMGANHMSIRDDKAYQIKSLKMPIQSIYSPKVPSKTKQTATKPAVSNNSLDFLNPNPKNGFNIHQKNADHAQFDIYSSEKDDSFSYQCSGKFVSIVDFDYVNMDELNKSQLNEIEANASVSQLIFEDVKYFFNCFVLLNEESLLLASENGKIYHLVLNNQEQKYHTYNFDVKFKQDDLELYKSGRKLLVDMCVDKMGNLLLLNRSMLNTDCKRSVSDYSVEVFSLFTANNSTRLVYKQTLFVLRNEDRISQKSTDLQCLFTRIYNFENDAEQSVILIDNANKRITWHKKTNGSKIRCIKTVENNLEDLKSFATIDEDNQLFLCAKAGLFCLKRQSKLSKQRGIKHFDSIRSCIDICYDTDESNIIFIDSNSVFRGRFFEKSDQNNNKTADVGSGEPLLKYKQLFSHGQVNRTYFKRVILSRNLIFVLANGDEVHRKNSVFIIDKNKLESFRS